MSDSDLVKFYGTIIAIGLAFWFLPITIGIIVGIIGVLLSPFFVCYCLPIICVYLVVRWIRRRR